MSKNKTILIIGAKSDIGLATAKIFARNGYDLQLAARNVASLDPISNDLSIRYDVSVTSYELNILSYESFSVFIDSLEILPDIVLCTVGILGNQKENQHDISQSSIIMRTNFEGPSLLLGEIANHFEKRKFGSIIGISSVAGDRGRGSNYLYGSGKAGFTAFLSGLRNRLYSSNVNVLTISPGFVETKMTKNLKLPSFITSSPNKVALLIFKNVDKSKVVYVPPWGLIMMIIRNIPEFIFKKLSL